MDNKARLTHSRQVFDDPTRRRLRIVVAACLGIATALALPFLALATRVAERPTIWPPIDVAPAIGSAFLPEAARERESVALSAVEAASQHGGPSAPFQRFAYLPSDNASAARSVRTNIDNIDVVLVDWYRLAGPDGTIVKREAADRAIPIASIVGARDGLRVMPIIDDQVGDDSRPEVIASIVNDRLRRGLLTDNLIDLAVTNGFAGVNLAFGGLDHEVMPRYQQFIGELKRAFAPLGLSVVVTVDLEDTAYDIASLSRAADTIIIDSFDRAVSADHPGAVAPQKWFADTIADRVAGADPAKLAVGVANFGYDWNVDRKTIEQIGPQTALRLARKARADIRFDESVLNPTLDYRDENGDRHTVWYLDAATTFNQLQASRALGIQGVAVGQLGTEDEAGWSLLRDAGTLDGSAAAELRQVSFPHHIDYLGDGAVLQIGGSSTPGARTISFDEASGLIVNERIDLFPEVPTATLQGAPADKQLVLTFDDGPDPKYTNDVLDILKRFGVKATFFVIGRNVVQHPDIVKRIVDEGHDIGNHTFYHPNVSLISDSRLKMELSATQRALETAVARRSFLFRPPYGEEMTPTSPDHMVPLAIATAAGFHTVAYTIDPLDWQIHDRDSIVQLTIEGARAERGGVVLFHDGGGERHATVAALPEILERLTSEGFTFSTVSDLIGMPRDEVQPPVKSRAQVLDRLQDAAFALVRFGHYALIALFTGAVGLSVARVVLIVVLALANRRKRPDSPDYLPDVAVVVPAHNEEKVIAKTVRSLLASTYPNMRIIVIDDGSTDRTAAVVKERFADDPRVEIVSKPNGGKATALALGFALSEAEIVVALDADTLFRPDTIFRLVQPFADPAVGAVAGNAKVGNRVNLMTRWQALEYIVSQNIDRRAFELINAIAVVPGAVGAWRRSAVAAAGGFTSDTLAEDTDLTIRISRTGYKVRNEPAAIAMTEAPDTIRGFLSQRSRWTLGTLQAAWKSRDALLRPASGSVGMVALPHILLFQILLPLLSPLADFFMILAVGDAALQKLHHPTQQLPAGLSLIFYSYLLFLLVDFVVASVAYTLEPREDRQLLVWLPIQRFFYRQLLYYVTVKSFFRAIAGIPSGWRGIARKATVAGGLSLQRGGTG